MAMETQWKAVVFTMEMSRFEVEGIFCIVILLIYLFAAMYVPRLKVNLGHQTGLAVLLGILAGYVTYSVSFYTGIKRLYSLRRELFLLFCAATDHFR